MKRICIHALLIGACIVLQPLHAEKKYTPVEKGARLLWNGALIVAGSFGFSLVRQDLLKAHASKNKEVEVLRKDIALFRSFLSAYLIADGIEGLYDLYTDHKKGKR